MIGTLIEKELKYILMGPKFAVTFLICAVLILLSLFIGVQDYKASMRRYEAAVALNDQHLAEKTSWNHLSTRAFRRPEAMQVFAVGVANDLGRFSGVDARTPVRLDHSVYADDPLFAVFRFLDLGFIFQVVLSLFAVLFTYNAINGEREMGTLKLTLANDIPRTQFVLAKFAGSWLALVIPLLIPLLLGLLMVLGLGVSLAGVHWAKLTAFFGVSLLYLTFFVALGVLVSGLTRHASASFLILLVIWVSTVLVAPRVGMMLAAKIHPAPSVAEVDGQIDAYNKERWDTYMAELETMWQRRSAVLEGLDDEARQAYRDDHEWEWMEEGDNARKAVEADQQAFAQKMQDALQQQKRRQEGLALSLSRFSPASVYLHAAMNLAGTHAGMKHRYETAIRAYQQAFLAHADEMKKQSGLNSHNGFSISVSSDGGVQMSMGEESQTIDVSTMPRFLDPVPSFSTVFSQSTMDMLLLLAFTAAALIGAYAVFMRYDVR